MKDPYGGGRANHAPPPGAQDFMVSLSLTYAGGGKDDTTLLLHYGLHAMGVHHAGHDTTTDSCGSAWPKPSLQEARVLFSGQTLRGNECFQIAANDARTLMLYSGNSTSSGSIIHLTNAKRVWFALR